MPNFIFCGINVYMQGNNTHICGHGGLVAKSCLTLTYMWTFKSSWNPQNYTQYCVYMTLFHEETVYHTEFVQLHIFLHKEAEAQRSSLIFQNLLKYKPGYKMHRSVCPALSYTVLFQNVSKHEKQNNSWRYTNNMTPAEKKAGG